MQLKLFFLFLLIVPGLSEMAYGHTVDAVGEYRVEIGWMNEPVVSGETNAIEFYVSPLTPCPDISEAIKCAESQEFQNGVPGLKVAERAYIEFPEPSDITVQQMIDGHTALIEDVSELKDSVSMLKQSKQQMDIGYAGIGVGIIGIAIAVVALAKSKKN